MKPLSALLILASITTSALAAGTDMHELASDGAFHNSNQNPIVTFKAPSRVRADISASAPQASVTDSRNEADHTHAFGGQGSKCTVTFEPIGSDGASLSRSIVTDRT
jgi:hypothetical protein